MLTVQRLGAWTAVNNYSRIIYRYKIKPTIKEGLSQSIIDGEPIGLDSDEEDTRPYKEQVQKLKIFGNA